MNSMFILHIFSKIKNVKTYLHIHPVYLLQLREKEFLVKCKWSGSMFSSKIPWGSNRLLHWIQISRSHHQDMNRSLSFTGILKEHFLDPRVQLMLWYFNQEEKICLIWVHLEQFLLRVVSLRSLLNEGTLFMSGWRSAIVNDWDLIVPKNISKRFDW